jgi:hypothetical protein
MNDNEPAKRVMSSVEEEADQGFVGWMELPVTVVFWGYRIGKRPHWIGTGGGSCRRRPRPTPGCRAPDDDDNFGYIIDRIILFIYYI